MKFQNSYRYDTQDLSTQLVNDGLIIFRAEDLYISGPLVSQDAKMLRSLDDSDYRVFADGNITKAYHWIHVEYASPKSESRVDKLEPRDSLYFGNVVMETVQHPGILAIIICQRVSGEDELIVPSKSEVEKEILSVKSQTLRCRIRGRFVAFYEKGGNCIAAATWKDYNKEKK